MFLRHTEENFYENWQHNFITFSKVPNKMELFDELIWLHLQCIKLLLASIRGWVSSLGSMGSSVFSMLSQPFRAASEDENQEAGGGEGVEKMEVSNKPILFYSFV